jgi:hypothetical protein
MRKTNPKNERIKHEYLGFLEAARRMQPETVDQVAAAINGFEESTKGRDFALFHKAQAIKFKRDLDGQTVAKSGRPLAVATKITRLRHVQAFFRWLAGQHGYKRNLSYSEAEYFNPSNHETAIASAERVPRVPTVEQIRIVIDAMPAATIIDRRNRALIAFTYAFSFWTKSTNFAARNILTYSIDGSAPMTITQTMGYAITSGSFIASGTSAVISLFFETDPGSGVWLFDDVSVTGTVSEVPVPAALPLLAVGLGALALMGRRKKQAA